MQVGTIARVSSGRWSRACAGWRTDYVDLLWLHMYDATTPIEEAVRALDDQVRLGKVLAVGISDSPAWVVAQANAIASLRGWSPFTALQIPYNVASREPERELLPMAQALGLALTPWGVLEAGILTGKPASERRWPDETASDTATRVLAVLEEIAAEREATTAQVAIAWLLRRPAGLTIVPIVAARRQEQIVDNLGALAVDLDADDIARLDAAGRPQLGFPRGFLESSDVRELIYGNTFEKLRA